MDDNYKIKNIYSSVSPSEIALRCTILDLCQRLKRTEVLCDYYEQCRNELVSDCIRLRQERDYYLMAHRNSLQRSEASNPKYSPGKQNNGGPQTPMDNNQIRQSTKIQPSFSFEKEIDFSKTPDEPDDNYEEIAKRLIAQFREEMEEIRRASLNGQQQQQQQQITTNDPVMTVPGGFRVRSTPASTKTINYSGDCSTMPTMLASPITPVRHSNQIPYDDASNSHKLSSSSDVPGYPPNKPPPPPPISNPIHLNKKPSSSSSTVDVPYNLNHGEYDEKIVIYDVLEDVQKGGGSGMGGGSRYYQTNQGITKRDSTSESNDKLPSPFDGSPSSSAYNRSQPQGQHQNRQRHVSNMKGLQRGGGGEGESEIDERRELRDSSTVIEVNPLVGSGYERGGSSDQQGLSNMETEQYLELCNRLLRSSINDFDTLTRLLMNQNEKLRKLKGKQLRSYFKRQLDQNNETNNMPKRP